MLTAKAQRCFEIAETTHRTERESHAGNYSPNRTRVTCRKLLTEQNESHMPETTHRTERELHAGNYSPNRTRVTCRKLLTEQNESHMPEVWAFTSAAVGTQISRRKQACSVVRFSEIRCSGVLLSAIVTVFQKAQGDTRKRSGPSSATQLGEHLVISYKYKTNVMLFFF